VCGIAGVCPKEFSLWGAVKNFKGCFPVNLFRIQDFDEKLADAAAQVQEAPKTKP